MKAKTAIEAYAAWASKKTNNANVKAKVAILHNVARIAKETAPSSTWSTLSDSVIMKCIEMAYKEGCGDKMARFIDNTIREMVVYAQYRKGHVYSPFWMK